jgi:hypothetical protein
MPLSKEVLQPFVDWCVQPTNGIFRYDLAALFTWEEGDLLGPDFQGSLHGLRYFFVQGANNNLAHITGIVKHALSGQLVNISILVGDSIIVTANDADPNDIYSSTVNGSEVSVDEVTDDHIQLFFIFNGIKHWLVMHKVRNVNQSAFKQRFLPKFKVRELELKRAVG